MLFREQLYSIHLEAPNCTRQHEGYTTRYLALRINEQVVHCHIFIYNDCLQGSTLVIPFKKEDIEAILNACDRLSCSWPTAH
jgi:hypothetical protein